jgi:subtilisin-like proprotein convertase family protein
VVLYDRYIDRFVVTQFTDSPNGFLFAVCQGSDPVNDGWYTYQFNIDSFPDYPKYSIWHDGYYITANKSSGNVVYVVERSKMAVGDTTAQIVGFDLPSNTENSETVFAALAMNSVGPNLPDSSKPGYIVYLQDDAWGGVANDHLKIWEVDLDWTNTANSTISPPIELATTPFDSFTATFGDGEVPQPGTGQKIDGITGIVSYMCNYWNYGSYNATTLNFNVDVNSNNTILGIRWFELREDAGTWSIYQEGTYAPMDGLYRFMGSMSLDINGNIGMAFNVGNSTVYPSLRYTGRYANDPLGQMTLAEEVIIDGAGVRSINRFGDYAQLTIDPTDDKTFWHTGEYVRSNGKWSTRVASFRIAALFNKDIGVTNIDSPVDGALTNNETVTITLFNYGEEDQTNFDVSYQIDGGTLITETYTGTLVAGESDQFTFATPADLSIEGHQYNFVCKTSLSGDEDTSNDVFTKDITYIAHNDLGVTAITSPVSQNGMGEETITVVIQNFGYDEQSNFDVSYRIQEETPVVEVVPGPLAGGESMEYSFTTLGDFSNVQGYNIMARTQLIGDSNNTNDVTNTLVVNSSCHGTSINTNAAIGPNAGAMTLSSLNYTHDVLITDINVSIDITHSRVSDLDIYLISPDGTRIELSTDNGGSGNNYTDTVFDDEASNPITTANAPFTGSFRPEGTLADLNGLASLGIWKLEITDDENSYGGTLNGWGVSICGTTSAGIYDNAIDSQNLLVKTLGDNHFIITLLDEKYQDKLNIQVFDVLGKELLNKPILKQNGVYTYPLNMEQMSPGVYIVKLGNRSFGKVKRIIVE